MIISPSNTFTAYGYNKVQVVYPEIGVLIDKLGLEFFGSVLEYGKYDK
ncbi:MAG: hypothetical protein R3C61_08340 [Bacteroidia bacterium]